ncbi:hypothetical protein DRH27_05980 [Candidatus Falkowbacteria bacterium]|nr:MAG: hypothetical protein DRH27_05980 [Candidatus Falkowbacteria bacterium]
MKDSIADSIINENTRGYNEIAEKFSSTRKFPWHEFEFFKDYVKSGDTILDAGCGNGRLYEYLKNENINYFGIDSSKKLIDIAKSNHPLVDFQIGTITDLPYPNNKFDSLFCVATLHHIPSQKLRQQVVNEFHRVLKPNGHLIMTNWNLLNSKWWPKLINFTFKKIIGKNQLDFGDVTKSWKDNYGQVQTKRYLHALTKTQIRKMLGNKFNIEKQFYTKKDVSVNLFIGFNLVTIAKNFENIE